MKCVFWISRRSGDLWSGICFQKAGLGFSFLSLYVTGNSWNLRNLTATIFPVFPPGISAAMNQLKHSVDEKFCQNASQRLWASLFAWCCSHRRLSPHAQEWMKELSWRVWKSIFSTSYQKHVNKDWQYPYRSNSRSVTASGWFLWAALKNSKEAFSQMAHWANCFSELLDWWVWNFVLYWSLWPWTGNTIMNGQTSDAGVPSGRSNSTAGHIFSIYDMTLKKYSWAMKLEIISSFASWRKF